MSHYDSCNEPPEETIKRLMGRITELEGKLKLEKAASDEQERRLRFAQDETAKAHVQLRDLKEDFESLQYDAAQVVQAYEDYLGNLDIPHRIQEAIAVMRDNGREGWWKEV